MPMSRIPKPIPFLFALSLYALTGCHTSILAPDPNDSEFTQEQVGTGETGTGDTGTGDTGTGDTGTGDTGTGDTGTGDTGTGGTGDTGTGDGGTGAGDGGTGAGDGGTGAGDGGTGAGDGGTGAGDGGTGAGDGGTGAGDGGTGAGDGGTGTGDGNEDPGSWPAELRAPLAATPDGGAAYGDARYELRSDRITFSTEIAQVAFNGIGKVIVKRAGAVVLDEAIRVAGGRGDLNLDSRDGDAVPRLRAGDTIQVFSPDGTEILSGSF
ncbi:MAG: hypothetical protein R2834_02265 [Rhodothermales bacterium]